MATLLSLPVIPVMKPVLGSFTKAIEGSVSLSFGASGGKSCDRGCPHHPKNKGPNQGNRCYAVRIEKRFDRAQLLAKMLRHDQTNPAVIAERALIELQLRYVNGNIVPWFRFSTGGSLPQPNKVTPRFRKALIALLDFCDEKNIPVHLPIETRHKAKFYRKLVGTRCVVRTSSISEADFLSNKSPSSFVVGTMDMSRLERVNASKEVAKRKFELTGIKTIVCPAVADRALTGRSHSESEALCGNCIACSQPNKSVIYPLH